ncbi:MAG: hypothetical protein ACUVXB_17510 [Bryobacteraceae bacterium]
MWGLDTGGEGYIFVLDRSRKWKFRLKNLSLDVLAKVYTGEGEVAVPLWNTASEPVACEIAVDLKALGRGGAAVTGVTYVDGGEAPYKLEGSVVRSQVRLAPHDIGIISIRTK